MKKPPGETTSNRVPRPRRADEKPVPESDRTAIERAKGLLMYEHGISSHYALALLIRMANANECDIATMARQMVEAGPPGARAHEASWLAAIAEVHRELLGRADPGAALTVVVRAAVRAAKADHGLLVLPDCDSTDLRVRAVSGLPDAVLDGRLRRATPWTSAIAAETAVRVRRGPDVQGLPRNTERALAPLDGPEGDTGCLLIARRPRHDRHLEDVMFDDDELELFGTYCRLVGRGLGQAHAAGERIRFALRAD